MTISGAAIGSWGNWLTNPWASDNAGTVAWKDGGGYVPNNPDGMMGPPDSYGGPAVVFDAGGADSSQPPLTYVPSGMQGVGFAPDQINPFLAMAEIDFSDPLFWIGEEEVWPLELHDASSWQDVDRIDSYNFQFSTAKQVGIEWSDYQAAVRNARDNLTISSGFGPWEPRAIGSANAGGGYFSTSPSARVSAPYINSGMAGHFTTMDADTALFNLQRTANASPGQSVDTIMKDVIDFVNQQKQTTGISKPTLSDVKSALAQFGYELKRVADGLGTNAGTDDEPIVSQKTKFVLEWKGEAGDAKQLGQLGGGGATGSWGPNPQEAEATRQRLMQLYAPYLDGLAAKKTSVVDNGYTFTRDGLGRTVEVSGNLKLEPGERDRAAQDAARNVGVTGDHGGHYIAKRFGGPGDGKNLFPQNANFNLSAYASLENSWARELAAGNSVWVSIRPVYPSSQTLRPDALVVTYRVGNSAPQFQTFLNQAGGP
jgi:hypothetical protein